MVSTEGEELRLVDVSLLQELSYWCHDGKVAQAGRKWGQLLGCLPAYCEHTVFMLLHVSLFRL